MRTDYSNRKLSLGYPGLDRLRVKSFTAQLDAGHPERDAPGIERQLRLVDRLAVRDVRDVLVIGAGPRPNMVKFLRERGYDAVGVEPVPSLRDEANQWLGCGGVIAGTAEELPVPDASQDLVYCNSVLEHVDSPRRSLEEMRRVLRPGGIAFIITTNRYRLSLRGDNGEYTVRFFNWLPDVVKESYVFHQLHYDPSLANYSGRPAVHWYSYADLCSLGRQAGFAQFYSPLDLVAPADANIASSRLRRLLVPRLQRSPWLRSLALTFTAMGGMVLMLRDRVHEAAGEARADESAGTAAERRRCFKVT